MIEIKMKPSEIRNYKNRKLREENRLKHTASFTDADSRHKSNVYCNNLFNSKLELTSIHGLQQLKSPDKSRTDCFSDNTENEYKHRSEAGYIDGKPNDWLIHGLLIELQKFNSICKLAIENNCKYGIYTSVMRDDTIIVHDVLGIYNDKSVMDRLHNDRAVPYNGFKFSSKELTKLEGNPLRHFKQNWPCKSNFDGYAKTEYKEVYFLPVFEDFIKPYVKIVKPLTKTVNKFVPIKNPLKK